MAGKRKRRRRKEFQRDLLREQRDVVLTANCGLDVREPRRSPNGLKPPEAPALRQLAPQTEPTESSIASVKSVASNDPVRIAAIGSNRLAGPSAVTDAAQPESQLTPPAEPDDPRAPILRVWRYRQFTLVVGGSSPYYVTIWMQRIGIGWLAWEMTHSSTWLGVVAAADLAPMILLAPIAGAICDRVNTLTMMRTGNLVMLAQALVLVALTAAGLITIELLFLLSLVTGTVQPFITTARQTVVPRLVPRADFPAAVALDSAIFQAARFLGPAFAAVMIPHAGVLGIFVTHTVGMIIMIVALFLLRLPHVARPAHKRRSMLLDVIDSFAYVLGHRGIWPVFVLMTMASILARPVQDMLPGFAGGVFHTQATGLAWLASAMGVGAMMSAGWLAIRARIEGLTTVLMAGGVSLVVSLVGFVATPWLWTGVLFSALIGFSMNAMSTSVQSLVQTAVSNDMRGRVMSLYVLIFRGTPAIGAIVLGLISDLFGLRVAFAIAAALALAIWALVAPRYRSIAAALEAADLQPAR